MSKGVSIQRNTRHLGKLLSLLFVFLLVLVLPRPSYAASYAFSPATGSYEVGKSFTVKVMVNAGGDAVNTGDATITYDSNLLTAVSAAKESAFNLWVTEPTIKAGTITFAGGGTTAISGTKAIVTITFKAKAEGTATVAFSKATLLAGAGQNVLSGSDGATFTITPAAATPEPTADPEEENRNTKIPPPDAPVIKSTTHPESEEWYAASDAAFNWDIPYGVTAMRLSFDQDEKGAPTEQHKPPIGEWKTSGVTDGVWYLHADFENRGGWGSSTSFAIHVDTTPPEEFSVSAAGGDLTAELRFEAVDALSGISYYEVSIDDGSPRDVQPTELTDGYRLTNLDPGEHTIAVTAFDMAGNERSAGGSVEVTGTKQVEEEVSEPIGFDAIYWVSLLFMAALAVVITMLIKERRKFVEEKDHIKRETMEVGDRLINIFGVLRDEIEEKVIELSHKPNMTDNERNILEGLKDALDISEELIDKEIEDVRKLLK